MTRIFRIDGEAVRARLREWAHSLGQSDANVLGVVLFGSFARGDYTAASDADILVILQESPYRFDERIPLYRPRQLGVSADVFPYTLEEAKQSLRERWGVVPIAIQEGEVLYCVRSFLRDLLGVGKSSESEVP
mgnify:CR=1 FL=1